MKHMIAAALALSMLAAPAMAAPNNPPHGQPHASQGNQHQKQVSRQQAKPAPKPQYSYNGRKYDAYRSSTGWKAPKGYGAHGNWSRGQKMPAAYYRDSAYRIDYRAYRLKQPPRGYVWVRSDRNVYLVSQQTGSIAQIVLNLFYY